MTRASITSGGVLADRFEIGARVGEGAMGRVYRAWDRATKRPVAVKMVNHPTPDAAARFQREAQVLSQISHAGVVGYVDRGEATDGTLWLAMDWIEGETLAARLRRGTLSIEDTVALGHGIAQGVGAAHRCGLTHRDIKPSNLLLPGGALDRVVVVDFGVVHAHVRDATAAGAILGTPGYMAPEQARGARGIDARADVFSLGCVLFECLTGVPAFSGDHLLAILAKILLEESPRVCELRPETPAALDDLIAAMLAKDPDRRPENGDAVAAELEAILRAGAEAPRRIARAPSLTAGEQRIISVVLAADPTPLDDSTLQMSATEERDRSLAEALPTGVKIERLADGTFLLALWGAANARDQAGQAARAALEMARRLGDRVVVATGRGVLSGRLPVGEVIERAVGMLRRRAARTPEAASSTEAAASLRARVWLDELTAGLLDSHFHVRVEDDGFVFVGEHPRSYGARQVCGVVTTCVGRERELSQLRALFDEVRTRSVARAAVLVAPAGVGKSRIRQELSRWIASTADVEMLLGRGDPMRVGSPFAVLAHALRWTMGLVDGETPQAHLRRIAAHVARFFERGAEAARVTRFLGELVGVDAPEEHDVALLAARRDPVLMGDLCRRAWLDWLRAVTADPGGRPIVVMLEDLHWGDVGTVELVDAALRELANRPLFVVALGRPELRAQFPRLWAGRAVTEIALPELSPGSSEELVREILPEAEAGVVARIVERAHGNAFYLEELIRAVAIPGGDDALPETVLATVQARLEALPADLRRVLRAGAVFGDVFSAAGVSALLAGDTDVRGAIAALVEGELVNRRAAPRVPEDPDFVFRHGIVREAAYAMLTEADRTLGHRLAGEWLERANPGDAVVLAEHFERGDVAERAVAAYQRAAEQAMNGNAFDVSLARAERGIHAGAHGQDLGRLRLLQAEAHRWRGELADAGARAVEALVVLPPGTTPWFRAMDCAIAASGRRADYADVLARARRVASVVVEIDVLEDDREQALSARVTCLCEAGRMLFQAGRYDLATEIAGRVTDLVASAGDLANLEPGAVVQVHRFRAAHARHVGDLAGDLHGYEAVLAAFVGCGDLRNACNARVSVGFAHIELGDLDRAEAELERALRDGEAMWIDTVVTRARQNLGLVRARRGDLAGAAALLERVVAESAAQGNLRFEGWTRIYLSTVAHAAGDVRTAEREAARAAAMFAETPPARAGALAARARALVSAGSPQDALVAAREAHAILEAFGGIEEFESLVWLALVEATRAAAPREAAEVATRALARLTARAATLADPALRARFVEGVPENARLVALCTAIAPGTSAPPAPNAAVRAAFDPDAFRREGHRTIDRLADYLERALAGRVPAHPNVAPADMMARWPAVFGDDPSPAGDFGALLERLLGDSQHQHHPGHMGHQVTAPLPIAALSDLAIALLNNGMAAYDSGPASTVIEKRVVAELATRLGFSDGDGLLTSGGSAGNLTALLAARQARAGFDVWERGTDGPPLAVLVSDQSHYSISRAIRVMGLGSAGAIPVATDARFRMRPDAAARALDAAARSGRRVFAIVASACTTQTGSIDPLVELAALAAERDLWLHVDGAHGASAVLSAKYRPLLAGIERADSVVWDAHKMMLQPALVTAVLFRRADDARGAFAQNAAYLFEPGDPERNAYDLGLRTLECTKRMVGFQLYVALATLGARAFGDYLATTFDLARTLADRLRAAPDFELACEPDTNIVCFRYTPPGVSDLDALQTRARAAVLAAGDHVIVQTKLPYGTSLRVTLTNPFTTESHLDSMLAAIRAVASR